MLYTQFMNSNGYDPFLINMLDTIVAGGENILTMQSLLAAVAFFPPLVSIVFC